MSTSKQRKAIALHPRQPCLVCGAKVINHNPMTVTCDPVCTRARKAGRTRVEQTTWEVAQPEDPDRFPWDDGETD